MGSDVAIGIDLGGTKLAAGVVDDGGRVSLLERGPVGGRSYDAILDLISDTVTRLGDRAAAHGQDVVAVGVATAAFLDADRDIVRHAPNLAWRERPFRADLRHRLGLPVIVENDADAAAWGEYAHGAGRGERCLVLATVGTGLGGGIVVSGALFRGGSGLGAEFGHLGIVPGGRPCRCGARGCLEQYASGTALASAARAAARAESARDSRLLRRAGGDPERIDGPLVVALARDGDPAARGAVEEVGGWLGRGLAQVAAVVDPAWSWSAEVSPRSVTCCSPRREPRSRPASACAPSAPRRRSGPRRSATSRASWAPPRSRALRGRTPRAPSATSPGPRTPGPTIDAGRAHEPETKRTRPCRYGSRRDGRPRAGRPRVRRRAPDAYRRACLRARPGADR